MPAVVAISELAMEDGATNGGGESRAAPAAAGDGFGHQQNTTEPASIKRMKKRTSFIGGRGATVRAAREERIARLQDRDCATGCCYLGTALAVLAACLVAVVYGGTMFANGWVSSLPTSELVPKASYIYDFSKV